MSKINSLLFSLCVLSLIILGIVFTTRFFYSDAPSINVDSEIDSSTSTTPSDVDKMDSISPEVDLTLRENTTEIQSEILAKVYESQVTNWDYKYPSKTLLNFNFPASLVYNSGRKWENGNFYMYTSFKGLPDVGSEYFYEGWLLRYNPFSFITTGKLIKSEDSLYTNYYSSMTDYSAYSKYILTLEINNDDIAPGIHIIEGDFK
jgi:hypothetical protein